MTRYVPGCAAPSDTAPSHAGLRHALIEAGLDVVDVTPMADTGLAHDHFWLHRATGDDWGGDWVARLPKQSQMDLAPEANLDYQACCFRRASQGGHTPALQAILPPGEALPRGGLVVTAISGRATRLPDDLPAIARALASLYTSTTWDVASHAVLDSDAIRDFYAHWAEAMANTGRHNRIEESALLEARRGMWLWSLTWCAKWRALQGQSRDAQARGEDWSGSLSSDSLIAHVAERVEHYLSPAIIDRVLDEWTQLASCPLWSER